MKSKAYRLGELFCGPGGIGLGAKLAGITRKGRRYSVAHAWANDIDGDACATYRRNLCKPGTGKVIEGNIRKIDFTRFGRIDGLTFGFPCNDFSIVGERKGLNGSYGPLYSYGIKAIKHFKPAWFIAENVGGLRSANGGDAFLQIHREMEAIKPGYVLTTHLYRFEEYGIPQSRHRVIIVGIKKSLGKQFCVPAPTHSLQKVTAQQAIEIPPIPAWSPNQELTRQAPRVVERLKRIRPGENVWTADLPKRLQLNVAGARLSQIYRRLDPERPAYTVTGSGGGGTHVYHWSEPRALTNRERARLQTFPDDYHFCGSKESVRKQIGMAVPPLGAKMILNALLKTLAGQPYDSIQPFWSSN